LLETNQIKRRPLSAILFKRKWLKDCSYN
jgi:hypothetical protein